MRPPLTSQDTSAIGEAEGSTPNHSAQLRSHLALSHGLSSDTSADFVSRLTDPSEACIRGWTPN